MSRHRYFRVKRGRIHRIASHTPPFTPVAYCGLPATQEEAARIIRNRNAEEECATCRTNYRKRNKRGKV